MFELPDKKRLRLLGQLARGNVLDIGCHHVQNPHLVDAVGFDLLRPESLSPNYREFVRGDCHSVSEFFAPKCFDTIVAGEIIEHLETPMQFLKSCHIILKDDGQLLITTPNPYHWTTVVGNLCFNTSGITFDHINLFPFRTMVALLHRSGFDLDSIRNASRGMRLWHTTRRYFIPCPKAIAWQHLYIARKTAVSGRNDA